MKKIRLLRLTIPLLGLLALGSGLWLLTQFIAFAYAPRPVTTIRVGTIAEYSTLIRIAEQEGIFAKNGLHVVTREFASGMSAMKGLLDGSVDITSAADFVGTRHSFETSDFMILTSIFESPRAFELVARKDRGIRQPSDLRGKKIGLTKKTMGEYFLGTFLEWHRLSLGDVTQVNGEPQELVSAIEDGTVDAVVTFNPHIAGIADRLGTNAVTFGVQHGTLLYALAYAKPSFVHQYPDVARRFIQSLVDAEKFSSGHPDTMRRFFQRQFQYSDAYVSGVVSQMSFIISLHQSMLLSMENQARWVIANKLTNRSTVPNYLQYVYFDALEAVKPQAISITR